MPVVRTFPTLIQATTAADLLASNGIPASVIGSASPFGGISSSYAVITTADAHAARELLQHLEAQTIDSPTDVFAAAVPDLALLDRRTPAPCPSCAAQLPLDASLTACPLCGAPVDVVSILLERYGPELLAGCYSEAAVPIPADVLDAADLYCPACRYSLRGLPRDGVCPECGTSYSKQALLRPDQPDAATPVVPGHVLDLADLRCPACHYTLRGLPRNGLCPECGAPYSKAGLLPSQDNCP